MIRCLTEKITSEFGGIVTPIQNGIRIECNDEHFRDITDYYKRICRHKRLYSWLGSTIKQLKD